MESILIKADIKDLQEIVTLFKAAISCMIANGIQQWDELYPNEKVLRMDVEKGDLYITRSGGKVVACAVINDHQEVEYETGQWNYTEGKIAVLHRLCVHPDAQGTGIGKKTMNLIENLARSLGYQLLRMDTFSLNPVARHVYEVAGYSYAGEIHFRKGLFYLMEKKL